MDTLTREAGNWWAKSRGAGRGEWVNTYRQSKGDHHRGAIVDIVKGLKGVSTVLEVGSNNGPNLMRLAEALPRLEQLSGIDVNPEAIADGQAWASQLGLSERVEFAVGSIPETTQALTTGCVDVVLSCYALAYIAPADLDLVLYEMGRLAKRAIVLAEPMAGGEPRASSFSGYHEWAHDYRAASRWLGTWRGCRLTMVPVEPPKERLQQVLVAVREES